MPHLRAIDDEIVYREVHLSESKFIRCGKVRPDTSCDKTTCEPELLSNPAPHCVLYNYKVQSSKSATLRTLHSHCDVVGSGVDGTSLWKPKTRDRDSQMYFLETSAAPACVLSSAN